MEEKRRSKDKTHSTAHTQTKLFRNIFSHFSRTNRLLCRQQSHHFTLMCARFCTLSCIVYAVYIYNIYVFICLFDRCRCVMVLVQLFTSFALVWIEKLNGIRIFIVCYIHERILYDITIRLHQILKEMLK